MSARRPIRRRTVRLCVPGSEEASARRRQCGAGESAIRGDRESRTTKRHRRETRPCLRRGRRCWWPKKRWRARLAPGRTEANVACHSRTAWSRAGPIGRRQPLRCSEQQCQARTLAPGPEAAGDCECLGAARLMVPWFHSRLDRLARLQGVQHREVRCSPPRRDVGSPASSRVSRDEAPRRVPSLRQGAGAKVRRSRAGTHSRTQRQPWNYRVWIRWTWRPQTSATGAVGASVAGG